jgi:predicted DCC family thiol-disulfide oxidoreductase YuxK
MTAERQTGETPPPRQSLVLYDGVCGVCNRLVSFLLRHDPQDQFRFAPLQSELAQKLLHRYGLNPDDLDTVVVLADFGLPTERALTRSEAVLWSIGRLGGVWKLFAIAKVIPFPLREAAYKFIARRRYAVFGKYAECPLPRPEDRHKFLS